MPSYNYPFTTGDVNIKPSFLASQGITLAPGDTLNIQPGNYGFIGTGYAGSAAGVVGLNGTSTNRITINFLPGATLGALDTGSVGYLWDNCSYITVQGIRGNTTGGRGACLGQMRGNTNNITFQDCKLGARMGPGYFAMGDTSVAFDGTLATTQWGFKLLQCDFDNVVDAPGVQGFGGDGNNAFVHDVEIHQCKFRNYSAATAVAAPINLSVCFNYRIHECEFSDIGVVGSPVGHNACVYAIGWGYVYRNKFGPNNWSNDVRAFPLKCNVLGLDGPDAQVRYYNNIMTTKRKYCPIEFNSLYDTLGPHYSHTSGEVWNNTVFRTAYSSVYSPSAHIVDVFTPDINIKNNVTIEPNFGGTYDPAGQNNYIWNNSYGIDWATIHATNNQNFQFFADSGLVDQTNWTPGPSSPLLNAGTATPSWLTDDYFGNPRSVGGFPDVGAVERFSSGGNVAPTANAGTDHVITLPTNTVDLVGSGTDPDGIITGYAWSKISGPAGATIFTPAASTTSIFNLIAGVYVFRLTVTDNGGATGFDDVQVTVNPEALAPIADAGPDKEITLPTDTITLAGSATDDGTISNWLWSTISTPSSVANIVSPNAQNTVVSGLEPGAYVFRLTVTDNDGLVGHDDIQVIVKPITTPVYGGIFGGRPNVAIAIGTAPFENAGINETNTAVIYEIGSVLKSYQPGRPINAITGFESGKGYYLVAKTNFDLSGYISTANQ